MKTKVILGIIVFIVILALIPFVMDWIIIGSNFPSNINNSDWVGFLGSYIGAVLGALVSLAGIIITIKYTNEQNKLDRELQIRPYCSIRYVHDSKLVGTNKILGALPIECEPSKNNGPKHVSILYIKNIGLGPAIEFEFKIDNIDDGRQHGLVFMQRNEDTSNRSVTSLQPGDEAAFSIHINFNFDPIEDTAFIRYGEGKNEYSIKEEVMRKYKNFNIIIHMFYRDMFQNKYYQKIVLSSNMYIVGEGEQKARHACDLNLKEITYPTKVENQ